MQMKTFSEFQARNLDGRRKKKCEFGDDEKKQIKKKMIFRGKLFRLAPILFLVVSSIDAIISRSESKRVQKKNGVQKHDNQASQTVKRDYRKLTM